MVNFVYLHRALLALVYRVYPLLTPVETAVATVFFVNTVAAGRDTATVSVNRVHSYLKNVSIVTVKKAISGLIAKGVIEVAGKNAGRTAKTYRFRIDRFMDGAGFQTEAERDYFDTLQESGTLDGLLQALDSQDREYLETVVKDLSQEEYGRYVAVAKQKARKHGMSEHDALRILIFLDFFGPEKQSQYLVSERDEQQN